jgi:hypothetical protein
LKFKLRSSHGLLLKNPDAIKNVNRLEQINFKNQY